MLLSICVLGVTDLALDFVSKFKSLRQYKKRDSDTEGVRVHINYVEDPDLLSKDIVFRYQMADGNFANVLNDGTQQTKKESTIGNDRSWLLDSNGHDTIVEATDDPDNYLDTLLHLLAKGYLVYITNDKLLDSWDVLMDAATTGNSDLVYMPDILEIISDLEFRYQTKLKLQRKNLLEDSYNSTQCGF